jgi:hypothetical protein
MSNISGERDSIVTDEQPGRRRWYLRRGGGQAGPFDSATVRRLLLRGQAVLEDEVSIDRESWQPVSTVPEVVPRELRPGGPATLTLMAQRRPLPLTGILVSSLLVAGVLGFAVWWGGSQEKVGPDCHAPPAPGVDWRNCQLTALSAAGSDLRGLRAQSADLSGAALAGALLDAALLDYANLRRADLAYAQLRAASLRGADLREADLARADLSGADLSFADFSGASVAGMVITDARLDNAVWTDRRTCAPGSVGACVPSAR